ncbi:hypothetical protein LCGC14_2758650, partial [marine sediment metagenome]
MKLVSKGAHHVSYRFMAGEKVPVDFTKKASAGYIFSTCPNCK